MKKVLYISLLFPALSFANCNLSTPMVNIGLYNPLSSSYTHTTSKITVSCPEIQPVTVKLSAGNNNNINNRALSNIKDSLLFYNIFLDPSHSNIFGNGIGSSFYSGPSGDISLFVKIPSKQNVSSGIYTDNILIEVSF